VNYKLNTAKRNSFVKIQHFEGSTLRAIHFQGSKLARLNDGFIGKGMHFEGNTLRETL